MIPVLVPAVLTHKTVAYSLYGTSVVIALAIDPSLFAAAVAMVITAIGGATVLIINALAKGKIDILEAQAALAATAAKIESHVDGMTTSDEDMQTMLRQQIVDLKATAERLAAAKAATDLATAVPSAPPSKP